MYAFVTHSHAKESCESPKSVRTEMTDLTGRRSVGAVLARLRHPYLGVTVALGATLVLVGALLATAAPTLGFRVGFLGAVVTLFGASGYAAFWVNDRGTARGRRR